MRVFVDERMEKTRANKDRKTAGQKGKAEKNLRQGEEKIRKQLSIAKAEIGPEKIERSRKKEGKIGLSSKKNAKLSLCQV